ncbi:hypothetical protein L1987_86449 [Smallanthus sonchifolius]|uniref:Uncharacterized protein n=1 Tax=Smallanthus sonchifolius TaxID=185202 RepID=A0ACB8Y3K2_9ASTR|nr:hypothetical protein L1987_86449 [Smallanthus sonchifolius]
MYKFPRTHNICGDVGNSTCTYNLTQHICELQRLFVLIHNNIQFTANWGQKKPLQMAGKEQKKMMEVGSSKGKAKAATVLPAKKKLVSTRMGEVMVGSVTKVAKNMKNKNKVNPQKHGSEGKLDLKQKKARAICGTSEATINWEKERGTKQ